MNKFTLALVATLAFASSAHAEGACSPNHQLKRFLYGTKYAEDFNETVKVDNDNYFTQIPIDDWQPGDNITICHDPDRLINTTRNKVTQIHSELEIQCNGSTLVWLGNTIIMFMDDSIKHENIHRHDGTQNPFMYGIRRNLGIWFTVCGDYGLEVYQSIKNDDAKDIVFHVNDILGIQSNTYFDSVERSLSFNSFSSMSGERGALNDCKKVKDKWAAKAKQYEQWRHDQYEAEAEYARQHPIESLDYRWWGVLGVLVVGYGLYRRRKSTRKTT